MKKKGGYQCYVEPNLFNLSSSKSDQLLKNRYWYLFIRVNDLKYLLNYRLLVLVFFVPIVIVEQGKVNLHLKLLEAI